MRVLFYIVLFLYTSILSIMFANVDFDFWARLIVGKTFFQTGTILNYDFLSYTPTHQWIDHEWGSSLVFYFIQHHFSDIGLFVLKVTLTFLTYVILIQAMKLRRKYTPNLKFEIFNILFFIFTIQAGAEFIFATVRCQIFTFFFFACWLYILEKVRLQDNYKLLWMLPISMILWSNLHGGCFIGLVLLGVYTVGEFLNKKKFLPYIYTTLLSLAACTISPYGIKYLGFLFMATTMKRENITEWQGLFHNIHQLSYFKFKYYALIVGTTMVAYLIRKYKKIQHSTEKCAFWQKIVALYTNLDKTKALMMIVMLILSIKSIRMVPFFTFCTIVFLYDDYYRIFSKKLPKILNTIKELILYAIILICFISIVVKQPITYRVSEDNYPVKEIDFIKTNSIKGNLFINFQYGSYATYKLYPNNHVFMDGRYEEVYYPDLINTLRKIHLGQGWKKNLDIYHTDILIIEKGYIIYPLLLRDKDWMKIEESDNYALFVPKEKYKNEKFVLPVREKEYYNKTKWETDIHWSGQ